MIDHLIATPEEIRSEFEGIQEDPAFLQLLRWQGYGIDDIFRRDDARELLGWFVSKCAARNGGAYRALPSRDPRITSMYYLCRVIKLSDKERAGDDQLVEAEYVGMMGLGAKIELLREAELLGKGEPTES